MVGIVVGFVRMVVGIVGVAVETIVVVVGLVRVAWMVGVRAVDEGCRILSHRRPCLTVLHR